MPIVSGSPSQEATTQPTVAALESVEVASFADGDLALVQAGDVFYTLDVESVAPRTGNTVLWTRNSNPLYNSGITTFAGRWVLWSTALGCACPTGPTGPPGSPGPSSPINSQFAQLEVDAETIDPAFVALLTAPIVTTGGRLHIRATVSATGSDTAPATGSFSIGVDGDVPPLPGRGFAVSTLDTFYPIDGGIVLRTAPLAPGAHTVTLYWKADASRRLAIQPVTRPDREHASLFVKEVP